MKASADRSTETAAVEEVPPLQAQATPGFSALAKAWSRDPGNAVLRVQRAVGNRAVASLLRQPMKPEPTKLDSVGDSPAARRCCSRHSAGGASCPMTAA